MFENEYPFDVFKTVVEPFLHEQHITVSSIGTKNGIVTVQAEMTVEQQRELEDELKAHDRSQTGF